MFGDLFTRGWRTSEFWVAVTTAVLGLANKYFDWNINAQDFAVAFAPAFLYIASRAALKFGLAKPVDPAAPAAPLVYPDAGEPPVGG